jgi:O-antigen/teichoic acid export membrane protein
MAAGILDTVGDRLDVFFIGKFYTAADVGYYSRAQTTQQAPASLFSGIVDRVTFPIFSRLAPDRPALRESFRTAMASTMLLTLPVMAGILVTAKSLVVTVFGAKWLPCVPYLRILAAAGLIFPLHVINLCLLKAAGRPDLYLRLEIVKRGIFLAALLASYRFGVMALVWALAVASAGSYLVNAFYTSAIIDYGPVRQLFDLRQIAAITAAMSALVWAAGAALDSSPAAALLAAVAVGAAFYLPACYLLDIGGARRLSSAVLATVRPPQ